MNHTGFLGMAFIGRASKWGQPLKSILVDYIEVSKDVLRDLKSNPAKAITISAIGSTIIAFVKKCPDLNSYKHEVIEYSNELGLCAEVNRNHKTKLYIDEVSSLLGDCHVEHWNLGVCSLILQTPCSSKCQNYHEVCEYLQPRKWMLYHKIIDIGMWNRWLILTRRMVDFDVNESEFSINESM